MCDGGGAPHPLARDDTGVPTPAIAAGNAESEGAGVRVLESRHILTRHPHIHFRMRPLFQRLVHTVVAKRLYIESFGRSIALAFIFMDPTQRYANHGVVEQN